MQYLVNMKLADSGRPASSQAGIAFIEQLILPTLEMCRKLESEKKILAGGPVLGAVALVLIVNVESVQELDELVASLPIWPRMETEVTPLTRFEGRMASLRPRLEQLRGTEGTTERSEGRK